MSDKKPALGRGLSALLQNSEMDVTSGPGTALPDMAGSVTDISMELIEANPFQPRTDFDEDSLIELAESIKCHGVIQPITLRKTGLGTFQLISGERRLKAAQIAGLKKIPAYIRIANDQAMLELALVENIQRKDLDPIEIAISFKRLIEECKLTHKALSNQVSKRRSTVTNYLRLLKLPVPIQQGLKERKITMGHARALINVQDKEIQIALYEETVEHDLSVRQVEHLVRANTRLTTARFKRKKREEYMPDEPLADSIAAAINKKVLIKKTQAGKGKVIIHFNSAKELEQITRFFTE